MILITMNSKIQFRMMLIAVGLFISGIQPGLGDPSVASASVDTPPVDSTTRKLVDIREVVKADDEGGFLRPRFSPDGLQLMLTRPGYQGIFLVPTKGGQAKRISEDNAFKAEWSKDGLIALPAPNDKRRILKRDGSQARIEAVEHEQVFCENDKVFTEVEEGANPVAISDNSDRFIAPQLCPKHKMVSFVGVESGIYLAPASASREPVFLGEGQDVTWAPDSSFIVYVHARDDGHEIVESDLYQYELRTKKLFNLTATSDLMINSPSLSPDGKTVAFEAEGTIYVGTIQ